MLIKDIGQGDFSFQNEAINLWCLCFIVRLQKYGRRCLVVEKKRKEVSGWVCGRKRNGG